MAGDSHSRAADRSASYSGRRRILVVDDDQDFAESLAILLRLENYEVVTAHGPDIALPLGSDVEVALVDIRLGHTDGVRLAAEMRQRNPELLVVMITAFASVQTAIKALRAGTYDYLCKPFHSDDLLATLDRCFERLHLVREREKAEKQLRHSQRMEAIGRLSAGIAHDFNNLLSVVIGNLRLAQEDMASDKISDVTTLRELIHDALDAALSGAEATRRLLAVGRAQPLAPKIIDIRSAVGELSRRLAHTLGDRIDVTVELTHEACMAYVDRRQFEASLLNLAINSRDAMDGWGRVRINVSCIDVAPSSTILVPGAAPGAYVRVLVEDNGCGMTAEVREQALQPFFTTKAGEQGSGLGLSAVYGFIRQSGGNLTIDSTPGVGTRVALYLPLQASRPDQVVSAAVTTVAGSAARILLVEDQATVRALFARQLGRLGYAVTAVGDASKALYILETGLTFDLLLSDVMLPGTIDGPGLCHMARQRWPHMALLLTTGVPASMLKAQREDAAPSDVPILQKPIDTECLDSALREALGQRGDAGDARKT